MDPRIKDGKRWRIPGCGETRSTTLKTRKKEHPIEEHWSRTKGWKAACWFGGRTEMNTNDSRWMGTRMLLALALLAGCPEQAPTAGRWFL